jgi:phosphoglycolate phosphatase
MQRITTGPGRASKPNSGAVHLDEKMRLILFDVDGTLLDAHGAGGRALIKTLEAVHRRPFSRERVPFAGRTDRAIIGELLRENQVAHDPGPADLEPIFAALSDHMERETRATPALPCPGVPALLETLERETNAVLGLVTGNLKPTAQIKMRSAGLPVELFQVGAFGDEAADRNQLPPLAVTRASALNNSPIETTIVVGDTPADIECARVNGLTSVAVATGPYSVETLAEHRPDFVLPDLQNLSQVLQILLNHSD